MKKISMQSEKIGPLNILQEVHEAHATFGIFLIDMPYFFVDTFIGFHYLLILWT